MVDSSASVAILFPGDCAARSDGGSGAGRFSALFQALAAVGLDAELAVYNNGVVDEV
jgi:hypothetical protein